MGFNISDTPTGLAAIDWLVQAVKILFGKVNRPPGGVTTGIVTLINGTKVVSSSIVNAGDLIFVHPITVATGELSTWYNVPVASIIPGVSFEIYGYGANEIDVNAEDGSTVIYLIPHT